MRGLLALLYALQALGNAYLAGQKKQREIDRHNQERIIRDQRIQQEHNRTLISDMTIEERALALREKELELRKRELEIIKAERALGLNGTEFTPDNYD